MMGKDYYAVLGVSRSATSEEISRAFRKLAQTCHPDKFPDDKLKKEEYLRYSEAYMVLDNADQKAIYDEFGDAGLHPGFDPEAARAARRAYESMGGGNATTRDGQASNTGSSSFRDFLRDLLNGMSEGMGEVQREIFERRAREAVKEAQARAAEGGNNGGGRRDRGGARPDGSGTRAKPHIKFGLKDLKIPFYEFNLIAGLMKAERTEGPVRIEQGNYRVIKDETGAVRVEVKLMRFNPSGEVIKVRPPKGFESKDMKKYDWVDASWISPLTVEGIKYPMSYRELIQTANEAALRAVHEGEWDNQMIEKLNSCARVSFPEDLKKVVKGEEAIELLTKEGDRWNPYEERSRGDRTRHQHRDEPRDQRRDAPRTPVRESQTPPSGIPKPEGQPRDMGSTGFTSFVGGRRK